VLRTAESYNWKILVLLLLFLTTLEFTLRGPVRVVRREGTYNDLTGPYIGAKAWLKGVNPYSNDVFWTLWKESGGADSNEQESIGSRTPYPWSCFLLLAPLSLLSWPTAGMLCGLLSVGMVVLSVWLLSGLFDLSVCGWRRWLFIALALALAPFHSGFGAGNLSMLAIALVLLSFWGSCTQRSTVAGLCCSLATCLKPPIGLFLFLYYALSRRWRVFGVALASTFLITLTAIVRLQAAGVPWVSSYLANSKLVLTDPINGITAANPKRFQMVNLQVLCYAVTNNERTANLLALLIGCLALLSLAAVLSRARLRTPRVLDVSALAVVSLLPVYHRYYDAALLILPLLWSLAPATTNSRTYRNLTLFLMSPFLIPGAWMLESLQNANRIPSYLTERWWWDTLVMAHQIWALLLLAVVLIIAAWSEDSRVCGGVTSTPMHRAFLP
jgi:hypothetical protein